MIARSGTDANNGHSHSPVRVALYCRKSSEKGMEQEFNSIDAQRQILETFVESHAADGWVALPDRYDDGGISGATLKRPGLQRLLADIEAGRIDKLAVYRLDRLSRSTGDFVQLLDFFSRHSIEVVSPNDRIEHATATDRLNLGMRIQFSQYERELAGERIRDKMRASRRRGLWQGGRPVLGYDVVTKKLKVNEPEAAQVREAFETFLRTCSLVATLDELTALSIRTKSWTTQKGRRIEGKPFDVHTLRRLLTNVLYLGRIPSNGQDHDGKHERIVDQDLWNDVQQAMANRKRSARRRRSKPSQAILQGLLKCGVCGAGMMPTYTAKQNRRYAYYVCHTLASRGAAACPGSRVPAGQMEASVVEQLRAMGRNPEVVTATVAEIHAQIEVRQKDLRAELRRARAKAKRAGPDDDEAAERVAILRDDLEALKAQVIDEADLAQALAEFEPIWEALFPAERARVLNLLLERVDYDARTSSVRLTFWSEGVRSLLNESAETTA